MNLPPLPRQNKRREAKVDSLVLDWFLENYPDDVAVEVKMKGNKLRPHQDLSLTQVKEGRFKYKIKDDGSLKPFDGFVLKKAIPFVATCEGMTCEAHNLKTGEKFTIKLKAPLRGVSQ